MITPPDLEDNRHAGKRKRRQRSRRTLPGSPPGILTADPQARQTRLQLITYDAEEVRDWPGATLDTVAELRGSAANSGKSGEPSPKIWLNVDGLADIATIARIGEIFNLHPLALEDVVNVHQRAKVDTYDGHLFVVTRMPIQADGETGQAAIPEQAQERRRAASP